MTATPPPDQPATPAEDPYATWDPSKATDEPDGLPDRAIVPLVEELRSRGIVTLQSCAGHAGSDDGTLWVRADTVDGAFIRRFLADDPFDRVALTYWPVRRWEWIWQPQHAEAAMEALRRLLPAEPADELDTAPAQPASGAGWTRPTVCRCLNCNTDLVRDDSGTLRHGDMSVQCPRADRDRRDAARATDPGPAAPTVPLHVAQQLRDAMVGQHEAAGHAIAVHTQGEDCSWCVRAADECDGSYACEDWKAWQAQYEAAMVLPLSTVPPAGTEAQ